MFDKLTLRQRILLGYLIPVILLLASLGLVFGNIQKAARAASELDDYRAQEDGAYQIALSVVGMQRAARGYLLLRSANIANSFQEAENNFHKQENLVSVIRHPQQQDILRRLLDVGGEVIQQQRRLMDLVDAGRETEALNRFRTGEDFQRVRDQANLLANRFLQGAKELRERQQEEYHQAINAVRNSILAGVLTAIAVALASAWWVATALSRKISAYAVQLAATATQLAATIAEHERTASQQAVAANQTSATIEELSASSRQSAEQAASVAALAGEATRTTDEGSATAHRAVNAMTELKDKINRLSEHIVRLNEQSGQIGTIAALVKDLSSEINMLALNAAVEASRAGEHGKGFAVVASEVRKLADQSRKSAEQTSTLITDIQKATNSSIMMTDDSARTVADVTRQAQEAGAFFEELANVVANVNMSAQQVMLNAQQQTAAFNQVVEATSSISAGTRETAAGISQTRNAVEQLNLAAQNLKAMV